MIPIRIFLVLSTLLLIAVFSACEKDKKSGCKVAFATNYDAGAEINDFCLCRYDGIDKQYNIISPTTLTIPPVRQETAVWCWLAVGEMIFRYYQLPNVNPVGDYQCGIIGAIGYSQNGACDNCSINCGNCIRPAGSPQMISYMISTYPKIASRNLFTTNTTLKSQFVNSFISSNLLISELSLRKPILAGINPGAQFVLPGNSIHVALIVGFHYSGPNLILHVNDPYPYFISGFDPYVFNGAINNGNLSYQIPYWNFVNGLKWNTSWYSIGW